ncbi:MAG: TrkH family potassium uptake protein [Deltaproteobacteria bacterium]|nr:TrkH family potassium uptake protein [Deltaproteobacteria bacterium]MBM4323210.1 TrkH family potassium uptake protein [Deltaproteobacteria bacterium]
MAFSLYYGDGLHFIYIAQMIGMSLLSLILRGLIKKPAELQIREAYLTVTLCWITFSLFGSIPFLVSRYIPNLTDAFFETMSGFTTTGATILTDIEVLPKSLLLWRNMTQWLGGMGVIALAVAVLPFLGVGGVQLFKAEVPGPIKDKISPRISETAKILWAVYLFFTVAEIVLLMLGGLSFFDSVCVTFGTLATGGFTPTNASIAAYPSPYIHYVVIVFMFIAGVNFSLHYWALRGKPQFYYTNPEFRFFLLINVLAVGLIMASRLARGDTLSEELIRSTLFQTVSIVTTTGFITHNYEQWPFVTQIILLALMFIGGCTSSTGGGMKNVRILVAFKFLGSELKKLFHPHGIFPIRMGGRTVPEGLVLNIIGFLALYILLFFLGVMAMSGLGLDIDTSVGAVAATLGNVGPGIGAVGPVENYAHLPALGKWILSFLMMVGRLEIFSILVIFTRPFWH